MSTLTQSPAATTHTARGTTYAPIPFGRIMSVELRKMFDTRSGFWLLASIGILAAIATTATIIFTPEDQLNYGVISGAIGTPMAVILPVVAILSVTSEWSQRSALTTFTLVPSRGRVIAAKAMITLLIGIVSMFVALLVGVLGNVVGSAIVGVDPIWDLTVAQFSRILLANLIGMFFGFMLGVVLRSSPAAIVGYFVYNMVLPGIFGALASTNEWFLENAGWFTPTWNSFELFERNLTQTEWTQLGVSLTAWLVIPLIVGLVLLRRSEVK